MKNIFKLFIVVFVFFFITLNVSAKTLGELKQELVEFEKKAQETAEQKKLTEEEMKKVNTRINEISQIITSSEEKIKKLNEEIIVLEEKAALKEVEIKDVIAFLQVTNSENAYMEYIFGAKSIEDLILRSAVSEQLVAYNDELIEDYNNTVKEFKVKQDELKVEISNLDAEQENLKVELVKLGDSIDEYVDVAMDVNEDIKMQKKMIEHYESIGCTDSQDINDCGKIPYSGKFIRPLASGRVTSEYGNRFHPTKHYWKLHSGIDLAGSIDVYAAAPGMVSGISWENECGGTMIFVHHNVGGEYYTSAYYHVYKVFVNVGDYVDQNTKIALTGGTPSLTPWDTCTNGRHLHFTVSRCLYGSDKNCKSWSQFNAHLINPRTVVNFPAKGVWFSNRLTSY